jgi:SPP1 family predicted phage head-tail adaptor
MMAGPLDRRILWERAAVTKDLAGGDVKTWSTLFETWCRRVRLTGAEQIQAGETVDEQTIKIEIRSRDGLLTVDRFQHEGKTYRVQAVVENDEGDGLLIVGCTRADGLPTLG